MNKCLLIVDVQLGFINNSTQHIPQLVEPLQYEYDYVYIKQFYNKANSFYKKLMDWHEFDKNSADCNLAFKPCNNAIFFNKSVYSCITYEFLKNIEAKNINEIDICGIETDICVAKCAADLFENKIKPRVLINYCASFTGQKDHINAIKTLEKLIGEKQVIK